MRDFRSLSPMILLGLVVASIPAAANTCNSFGTYTCGKPTPDLVRFVGTGTTGQSIGILLGSNTFNITFKGNRSLIGDDLFILAAGPNGLTGKVNGVGFTSVSSFPEGSAIHAIQDTWSGMGIVFNSPAFGYANVGAIGSGNVSITAKGVDAIAVTGVNDVFVMDAWKKASGADKIEFLSDGNGDFAKAIDLWIDGSGMGLGVRSKRYSMLVEDGVVKSLNVEEAPGKADVSGADTMLKQL